MEEKVCKTGVKALLAFHSDKTFFSCARSAIFYPIHLGNVEVSVTYDLRDVRNSLRERARGHKPIFLVLWASYLSVVLRAQWGFWDFFFFSIMQEMLNKHFLFTPTNLCDDLCQLDTCNSGSCPPLIQNEIFQGSEMRFVKKVHQLIWHIKSGSFFFYLGTSRLDFASNLEFLLGLGPCQTKLTSALRASDRTIHVSHKNVPEM